MRKVLSFVLVLSLVLSSFSMAFAADTTASGLSDINGIANEDAIQVAYDLEIITGNPDGTFLPEKAVNRAEFAAMLTRALSIPDSALAGYTTTSFKDTAGYTWAVPYLAFCQSKGILLGDGAGNVMPGRTVSVNEAMTMALRAIGYTANSSLLVGAWPSNYVSLAQNNDLYDDVATTTTVNKASAAQIIYNLLTVQKAAVNTDGTTDPLWKNKSKEIEANLLNTNLGCTEDADEILGTNYDYDNTLINITGKLGAYGTAYYNSDDDLVAFTVDSTSLTGKLSKDKTEFEVGDVTYDVSLNTTPFATDAAMFTNGADKVVTGKSIDVNEVAAYAKQVSDDGETITLNVDLSGKKIKDIYSMVAWDASASVLASSDVQDDIADNELEGLDFVLDDDDNIDMTQFELVGAASLDKIAKDDVVYVYADGKDIRKVEVGTETVQGVVEEADDDTVTIAGKDYDMAPNAKVNIPGDVDVDSDGTFYLDVNGEVFDFDGSGNADTFAVVKFFDGGNGIDSPRMKLFKSDDSTETLTWAEDNDADMDWESTSTASISAVKTTGALIGYSLNSNGKIDNIDNSFKVRSEVDFQSTKVLSYGGVSYSIDSDAVVFTYKATTSAVGDYDMAKLNEVKHGDVATTGTPASIILNDDKDVVALFIEETAVDVEDDDVYGVINTIKSSKTGDDEVYTYVGFIDGTAFTKKTDDRANASGEPDFDKVDGTFGVYKITVDANDVITKVAAMTAKPVNDKTSGMIVKESKITDINSDKTVVTTASGKYTIADDAVVYIYDVDDSEFSVAKLSSLRKDYTVTLYDTKGEDANGVASVVIYYED